MSKINTILATGIFMMAAISVSGCAPEVGSEKWCQNMQEKPKGDWSVNEASDYTKHCLLK